MPALSALLEAHEATLARLYTSLTPSPAATLAAKQADLHRALANTVAAQLAEAQDAVAHAEARVAAGWLKVADWRTALGESGGSVRGEGPLESQAGEVERVLDGMRSRMEARGTQIVVLQTRLANLALTLGTDFLALELERFQDGWDALDLRLERMSALEREVLRCDAEITRRRTILNANVNEIFQLRTELGIHQDTLSPASASHPSESANAPISDPFDEAILCHLGVGDARDQVDLTPTSETLQRVEAKRKWLEEEKDHRNQLIQTTYDRLYPLWAMLGVSDVEMDEFVNRWMGSTPDVVNAYQAELQRMLTLKRSNLSTFIIRERDALTALWDALYLSPQQRLATFPPFAISVDPTRVYNAVHGVDEEIVSENVSEELLVAHERERERVEAEVEGSRPVLDRLAKYFEIVEEMRELEASASDPSRLLGKSTRGDPGRLLREEKARKRVIKDKPKLEMELRQIIPVWEKEHGRPFLINGVRFIDQLDQRMAAEAAEKEAKKRGKSAVASASASTNRGPAPALRAQKTGNSSSTAPAPIKRQMTGSALASATKRQIPMSTGGSSASSVRPLSSLGHRPQNILGEIGNATAAPKLVPQSTGRGYLASSTTGGGGMKIPAGWGGSGSHNPLTAPADAVVQQAHATATATAFRPRSSTLSSASGASNAPTYGSRTGGY